MMGWTEADGDALFRQPPDEQAGEDASSGFDGSHEAMRRLRFPFEANPADAAHEPLVPPAVAVDTDGTGRARCIVLHPRRRRGR